MYGLSIGDKSEDLGWTLAYFSGSKIFPQRISCKRFVGAQRNLAALGVWPIEIYSPNFVNFGPGVPWYHASVLYWCACKVFFFDNFPMFTDSFSVLSPLPCPRIRCKLSVQVWGTPTNFNGFCVLAALLHGTLVVGVSQAAALNRGRHLYSAGRPSRWALAHISSFICLCRPILCVWYREFGLSVSSNSETNWLSAKTRP